MPCYHPLHGYRALKRNASGKHSWTPKAVNALNAERLSIPCSRCIGCRLEHSRQWAMRCCHENQLHEESCFLTLTYDDENVPYGGTLLKKDFQDFAKRLRRFIEPRKVKYYHCGEYGEQCASCGRNRRQCECRTFWPELGRPHYHALLFGYDFPDKLAFKKSADGSPIYTSEILSRLWPAGFCTAGAITFESAAYVARYVTKKIGGMAANIRTRRSPSKLLLLPYERLTEDGEIVQVAREYTTMSLKEGGIGGNWFKRFKADVYPSDSVVLRGKEMKPPKFYDRLLELEDPEARAAIRERRMKAALERQSDSTDARLLVREQVKLAQSKQLKRGLE